MQLFIFFEMVDRKIGQSNVETMKNWMKTAPRQILQLRYSYDHELKRVFEMRKEKMHEKSPRQK